MANFPRPQRITGNTITRPADTTVYADQDLVANSATAGSVTPFTFSGVVRNVGYRAIVRRVGLLASQVLLANGTFRLHLFTALPTVTNGDNGALDAASNGSSYIGWYEVVLSLLATGTGTFGWSSDVASVAQAPASFISVNST